MISVNKESFKLVELLIKNQELYKVGVKVLENGATVLDLGQEYPGSWEAGKILTEILLGGIGQISFETFPEKVAGFYFPAVNVRTDYPILSLAGCQISGWELSPGNFAPILAGPGRTLGRKEGDWLEEYSNYSDDFEKAIISIESPDPVSLDWSKELAQACRIDAENLYVIVAPPSCLATAIQVSGRILEQALHRIMEEGFPLENIKQAQGFCVIPPLVNDDLISMGRMNDSLIYGGQATFTVDSEDKKIKNIINKITSDKSPVYGQIFKNIFKESGCDFYQVPMETYSPAAVSIVNERTGNIFNAGNLNLEVLEKSFTETIN